MKTYIVKGIVSFEIEVVGCHCETDAEEVANSLELKLSQAAIEAGGDIIDQEIEIEDGGWE